MKITKNRGGHSNSANAANSVYNAYGANSAYKIRHEYENEVTIIANITLVLEGDSAYGSPAFYL